MKLLYFDCFSGAAGDMILGALIDAGLPLSELKRALGSLGRGPEALEALTTARSQRPDDGALLGEELILLDGMGRAAEERAAWQALLDTFPKSTQRKRAQARLAELGGAAPGAAPAGSGAGRAGAPT